MLLLPYAGTTRIRFKGFHLRPAQSIGSAGHGSQLISELP